VPSLTPTRRAARPALARGETPSPLAVPSGCRFRTRCPRATDRCVQEEPQIAAAGGGPGHFVACHHPLQTPAEAGVATAS